MSSPFDNLWDAILHEQKANHSNNYSLNETEVVKKVLELFAKKSVSSSLHDLETNGRICKSIKLAVQNATAAGAATQQSNLYEALSYYNHAIRFCPFESEEISTFFRRRSEILIKLNEKEAARCDARRAAGETNNGRQAGIEQKQPIQNENKGRGKRKNRKERPSKNSQLSEQHKPIVNSGQEKIPSLTPGPHSHFRHASRFLELKSDPQRGRHFVAAKEFPAGAVVIVEPAYVSSPLPSYFTSNCSYCCSPLLSPVGCPQCAAVLFCNESCRDNCLRDFHTVECPVLQHLVQGKELTPMALLVYRTVIKGSKFSAADPTLLDQEFRNLHENSTQQNPADACNSDYRAVFYQVTNADSRNSADRLKRAVTAAYLTECLSTALKVIDSTQTGKAELTEEYKVLLTSAFFHHLQSSSCNAYQVTQQVVPAGDIRQSQGQDIGGAIFPTIALLNHSCSPNVARHTHGSICIVRTTRPIEAGEEILDNYGPHFLSDDVNDRRRYLRLHYFFECDCPACDGKWPAAAELRTAPARIICVGCRALVGEVSQPDDVRTRQTCSQCKKKNDFLKLIISWREFEGALPSLLSGDSEKALRSSLRLLNTLKTCVQSPSNLQARATQVATLSWSLQGNRINSP